MSLQLKPFPISEPYEVKPLTLSGPTNIHFLVTPVCNLRCVFCGVADKHSGRQPELRFEQAKAVADKFLEANPFVVELSGGEPLLYPHLLPLMKYLDSYGVTMDIYTNATFLPHNFDEVAKYLYNVGVSIHGIEEDYDKVVGFKGKFKQCVESIGRIKKAGVGLYCFFTATKLNYKGLPRIAEYLVNNFDIDYIAVNRAVGETRVPGELKQTGSVVLNTREMNELLGIMYDLQKSLGIELELVDNFPFCLIEKPEHMGLISACGAGTTNLSVDITGNVYFCALSPQPLDNIFHNSLTEIWDQKLSTFHSFEFLPHVCQNCNMLPSCKGGCNISCCSVSKGEKLFDVDEEVAKSLGLIKLETDSFLPQN